MVKSLAGVDLFVAVENAANEIEAERAFDAGLEAIRPLVETAPDEIEPSAVAYVEGFEAYGAVLAAAGYNGSAVDRDALADITLRVGTARAEIEAYATRSCS